MATSNLSFGAQVESWVQETQGRMTAVFHESTQRTFNKIVDNLSGGMVGVVTGFLRASARASLSAMPPIDPAAEPKSKAASYPSNFGEIVTTIASSVLGQTIYIGYTANYSGYVEYGTSKMRPRPYVGSAAAQWQAIVSEVVSDLKGRTAGPSAPSKI